MANPSRDPLNRTPHIADLLRLVTHDPGRPRLTWYDDNERIELSGSVLENWINKTANLLVEEFDAGPRTTIAVDLPPHWRSLVWALATWRTGAATHLDVPRGPEPGPVATRVDIAVTDRPQEWGATAADVVAVALAALARGFDGPLPAGAIDAASSVMTYGDRLGLTTPIDPDADAVLGGPDAARVLHSDLVPASTGEPRRRLVDGSRPLRDVAHIALATWASDGSVVLLSPATAHALGSDRLARLAATERIDDIPAELA